jgi:hypothetical protein
MPIGKYLRVSKEIPDRAYKFLAIGVRNKQIYDFFHLFEKKD